MAFDGLVLYAVKDELKEKLNIARIDRIYQPDENLITIMLRGRGKNFSLLLSADPQFPGIHLTQEKFTNPPHPPAFCMLLRKHLTGGRVIEIEQPGFERILHIVVQNLNAEGEVVKYCLVIELMGRHSNVILLSEDGIILDAIKRIPPGLSRYREILPGKKYENPPSQDKANPLVAEKSAFIALLQLEPEDKLFQAILKNYRGISPLVAKEIVFKAGLNPEGKIKEYSSQDFDNLWSTFERLFSDLQSGCINPVLILDKKNKIVEYYCFFLEQYKTLIQKQFSSMNELLDYHFVYKIKKQLFQQLSGEIKRTIKNLLEKYLNKQQKLLQQLKEAENADEYRIKGEMLTANLHQIKKGNTQFTTINYYDPELKEITIELDPALSPQNNAAKYFKKYNKLKNSVRYIQAELSKLIPEIEYLKNVELSLENIESRSDFEEIKEELINEGYIRENKKITPNRKKIKSKPMKFKSSDGFDILVGRNNRQNDELTKKIASREDIWLHAKEIPGSHVIIRKHDNREIPDRTLEEAAIIAAYYSKGRESTTVSIDYTPVKYVNKPKGAKPGLVFYENYQTITVNPDRTIVETLKVEE